MQGSPGPAEVTSVPLLHDLGRRRKSGAATRTQHRQRNTEVRVELPRGIAASVGQYPFFSVSGFIEVRQGVAREHLDSDDEEFAALTPGLRPEPLSLGRGLSTPQATLAPRLHTLTGDRKTRKDSHIVNL